MSEVDKQVKSFNLKKSNVEKVEKLAYENKEKQSTIVDNAIEDYDYGSE